MAKYKIARFEKINGYWKSTEPIDVDLYERKDSKTLQYFIKNVLNDVFKSNDTVVIYAFPNETFVVYSEQGNYFYCE